VTAECGNIQVSWVKNGEIAFENLNLKLNIFSGKLINLTLHGVTTTVYAVLHSNLPAENIFMSLLSLAIVEPVRL
jgi:hypothetical protein